MRIVSFDHVLAGPYGTTILAELGADVFKIESSKGGMDPFRFFGTGEDPNLSPRFLEFNRNKRSFTVNLKHPKGQGVLHDLVAKADAVLDNYSVDVVERIGLSYDQLLQSEAGYRQSAHARPRHYRTQAPFLDRRREHHVIYRSHLHVESPRQYPSADRLADGISRLRFRDVVRDHYYLRRAPSRSAEEEARSSTWRNPKRRRS